MPQAIVITTTRCPVNCAHCQYSCTMDGEDVLIEELREYLKQAKALGFDKLHLTGGEPFLDIEHLSRCVSEAARLYEDIVLATSACWAYDKKTAENSLRKVQKISRLHVSIDRFHLKTIPIKNIENVLRAAASLKIKTTIRPSFDKHSHHLFEPIKKIIDKYSPDILYSYTDPFGRGELLDAATFESTHDATSEFEYGLKRQTIKKKGKNPRPGTMTLFPDGNVYGCCIAMKQTLMGNLREECLRDMLNRFKRALPGHAIFNEKNCGYLRRFLTDESETCEFCRNQPFDVTKDGISVGRDYFLVDDIGSIPKSDREILLAFDFKEKHLNMETGMKLKSFFRRMESEGQRFVLARPLYRCQLGADYRKLQEKYHFPKNCFECKELFTVSDGRVVLCARADHKIGPAFVYLKDRKDIHALLKLSVHDQCKHCVYLKRRMCHGLPKGPSNH